MIRLIQSFSLITLLCVGLSLTTPAAAQTLTRAEIQACRSLSHCIDIVKRHGPHEFDYTVLETEFRRYGARGRKALFRVALSESGNAGIAKMVLALGPLLPNERAQILSKWSEDSAAALLPFATDKSLFGRDLLLRATVWSDRESYFAVRRALGDVRPQVKAVPLSPEVQSAVVTAAAVEPLSAPLASYLARVDVGVHRAALERLLSSPSPDIRAGAYDALQRENPNRALGLVINRMKLAQTPEAAVLWGEMLVTRHKDRADGFYRRLATTMSGDADLPVAARAAALHAVLRTQGGDATPNKARGEALDYLLQANVPHFVSYTTKAQAYRDQIAKAAQHWAPKIPADPIRSCRIAKVDLQRVSVQMPFFEGDASLLGGPAAFVIREDLLAAHPTAEGWLAAYSGGTQSRLLHFDTQTGLAQPVKGLASRAAAILPDRVLRPGETARSFWVVDDGKALGGYRSLYRVERDGAVWRAKRMVSLPKLAANLSFAHAPQGQLVIAFEGSDRVGPLRYTPEGTVHAACGSTGATMTGLNP